MLKRHGNGTWCVCRESSMNLKIGNINTWKFFCEIESISFARLKIWNIVPNEFREETLNVFKKLIKKWKPENCSYKGY